MLPATLQFLIVMIASAIDDRLQRKLDYVEEERLILWEEVEALTGGKPIGSSMPRRKRRAPTQAQRIDPDDPRTNLNLSYTLSGKGDQPGALATIAHGLAHDGKGHYRPRLLEKQAQVLALISERASAEQGRLVRRDERFR